MRIALRGADGQVRVRTRLCWADTPSVAAVLEALLRRAAQARRGGLELLVEQAPADLVPLLGLAGLDEVLPGRWPGDGRSVGERGG